MQLKELTVKELQALFDASAHEQIREYFEDPEIHYIVVFANHFQPDMGLLTVGPNQDCTSLEQAKRAIIDRKFAKFMVRCLHCPKERKKADAPAGLVRPIEKGTQLEPVRAPAPASAPAPAPVAPAPAPVAAPAARPVSDPAREAEISARAAELDKREAALKAVETDLKQREDDLVEREDYVTQSEESLIEKIQKQERRGAELEQQEENIRRKIEELARKEAAFDAKVAAFKSANPSANLS